ncbi:hypothetical protein Sjap_002321 [Stephania japonica]|uniref:Uncharacterized protein n=1 Tax=Stephania japonica TaxID=461633 RepID=A0AAP0PW04_9MAGN
MACVQVFIEFNRERESKTSPVVCVRTNLVVGDFKSWTNCPSHVTYLPSLPPTWAHPIFLTSYVRIKIVLHNYRGGSIFIPIYGPIGDALNIK